MGRAKSWRKTVVVGAGPVGCLAALYAANRGDQVEVYELRKDLRQQAAQPNVNKSINLALSERGVNALRESGYDDLLDTIFEATIPMHGRMIHTRSATGKLVEQSQAYDVHGRFQRSVDRNELNIQLLDKLATMPNVTVHFQQKLTGADFDTRRAWFEDLAAKSAYSKENPSRRAPEHEVEFDFMIGADGAHSAVRFHLMKFAQMDYAQNYIDCLWCEFSMTADLRNSTPFGSGYRISPEHLHIWPAGSSMFIALPTHDGQFVCTLFGTRALFSRLEKAAGSSTEAFVRVFDKIFPGVDKHIPAQSLVEQFKNNPHLPLINIKCSPHHYGSSVVILGDSANAMVPFYGQGMNAGLESVHVLFKLLDATQGAESAKEAGPSLAAHQNFDSAWDDSVDSLAAALREYSHVRVADTHAICDLALGNYHEMASGVVSKSYKARKWVEEKLYKYLPSLGWETQYSRVSFGRERYSQVIAKARHQGRILETTAEILGLGVTGAVAYYVWRFTRFGRK